jgi:heme exporter protein D
MDPLHCSIALGPLAAYTLLLGLVNLSGRPFLTTGARDTAALGVAISGFVVAGPMELFLPHAAATRFGPYVWLLLLAFYGLCLTLVVLLLRPRLVIYNVTVEQLRPILAGVVSELDREARWAGESLVLPQLGVQLNVESFPALRNTQLAAAGPHQSYLGWRRLEISLVDALRGTKSTPNPYGFFLISFGVLIASALTLYLVSDRQGVAQALGEMLHR